MIRSISSARERERRTLFTSWPQSRAINISRTGRAFCWQKGEKTPGDRLANNRLYFSRIGSPSSHVVKVFFFFFFFHFLPFLSEKKRKRGEAVVTQIANSTKEKKNSLEKGLSKKEGEMSSSWKLFSFQIGPLPLFDGVSTCRDLFVYLLRPWCITSIDQLFVGCTGSITRQQSQRERKIARPTETDGGSIHTRILDWGYRVYARAAFCIASRQAYKAVD